MRASTRARKIPYHKSDRETSNLRRLSSPFQPVILLAALPPGSSGCRALTWRWHFAGFGRHIAELAQK
jgi:hypothetical protein